MTDAMASFSPPTRDWFCGAFAGPTDVQREAWRSIAAGHNALVVAPTGSGKTLAAFLWAIDRVFGAQSGRGTPSMGGDRRATSVDARAQGVTPARYAPMEPSGPDPHEDPGAASVRRSTERTHADEQPRATDTRGHLSPGPTAPTEPSHAGPHEDPGATSVLRSPERTRVDDGAGHGDPADLPDLPRTRVVYVSPLKALGVDVERNLRSPLVGIAQAARRLGMPAPDVTVGIRSGDTPAAERRRLVAHPPDILITTPESLYLMLTSRAGQTLRGVDTVIVDEVHAVAATKRGAHVAVTLERLDLLLPRPAQRIGLSATVRPLDEVARFIGGAAPVDIVAPRARKAFDVHVIVPVPDMTNLPPDPGAASRAPDSGNDDANGGGTDADDGGGAWYSQPETTAAARSIWPHVEEAIVDRVLANRSTIVFANSRRLAERLTTRLNEIYAERLAAGPSTRPSGSLRDRAPSHTGGSLRDRAPSHTEGSLKDSAPAYAEGSPRDRASAQEERSHGHGPSSRPSGSFRDREGDAAAGADAPVLAKAHHGSVSKEQRAVIEDELKRGILRCVVATSSLELGIDMGAVDLVIQVEAPPSAASGLQRIGRAGHNVGDVSRAALFPKHRSDVLHTAVVTERMLAGQIEAVRVPQNPLDILAQQTVAACALQPMDVEDWYDTVRRSAPFRTLPRSAYEATLDLVSGRFPSDEFAELRPRVVWDRDHGTLTGRPGAQRIAVTSGGTIPDRGLFGVFVAGETVGARVGELDEEMVYESRVNDVFTLGTTSWRIVEITHDRVNVVPAFGQPGKVPFWHGDGLGRPAELGEALGRFTREVAAAPAGTVTQRLSDAGLDDNAAANLRDYLDEQRQATGTLPSDRTLTVERSRDEVGDWRIILHSPYGMQLHAPWALAVAARIRDRLGVDGSAVAADDGIIARVPDADAEPPGAELFVFEPDELDGIVTSEVGGSALFASRFRECAARALLMPRYRPGRRSPLWQQRQRAAQLLEVAQRHPTFPIILETLREVLQDVYDVPALVRVARGIQERRIRLVEVETAQPSPFARDLLFGYVGTFMYQGDSPLAERRAAALSVDPALLAELLGTVEMRELLDPDVIAQFEREVQRLDPDRRVRGTEGVADLLRLLGPLDAAEVAVRLQCGDEHDDADAGSDVGHVPSSRPSGSLRDRESADPLRDRESIGSLRDRESIGSLRDRESIGSPRELDRTGVGEGRAYLDALVAARRAIPVTIGGVHRVAAIEDAGRLRDALGTALPIGVPVAFLEPVQDPLGDLVSRHARTHGPFRADQAAARLGVGVAVVRLTLHRLEAQGRVTSGFFLPETASSRPDEPEWCDTDVLRRLRMRSLAAIRGSVEPVSPDAYARFLPEWQHLEHPLDGVDGVLAVVEQLAGVPVPVSAWESLILPSRVRDYAPGMLDELTASGEVLWSGHGSLPGRDGWVALHPADIAPLTLAAPDGDIAADAPDRRILDVLAAGGAYFTTQLRALAHLESEQETTDALWRLAWAGRITNDTFAPLRALLTRGSQAHKAVRRAPRARMYRGMAHHVRAPRPASPGGRWSLLPPVTADAAQRTTAAGGVLLDRYGVVTRGAVVAERLPGGFAQAYRTLAGFEQAGHCRRGYIIEKLGAAQFAASATIDRLRTFAEVADPPPRHALTLAACDPANPYGAALAWPATHPGVAARPGRKAGALVVMVDGMPALYIERGGRTTMTFTDDDEMLAAGCRNLAETAASRHLETLTVEQVDGSVVFGTPLGRALRDAGFVESTRGLTLRHTLRR